MIISKTPFRVSLFGGSTDYESFYSKFGSLIIGFSIDKYCYISVKETPKIFDFLSKISYFKIEIVNNNSNIKHNGVRGILEYLEKLEEGYEIYCASDLPAQTGIGSSSSFVVGLLNCLTKGWSKKNLAKSAMEVERRLLNEAGGIQDQIWAAYGGINSIRIARDGNFSVIPMPLSEEFKEEFMSRCIMIYTGQSRRSFQIAASHDSLEIEDQKLAILEQAQEAYGLFYHEDIDGIAECLHKSWGHKKKISNLISTQKVDSMYKSLQTDGMIGGKLLGAGGSGFIFGILREGVDKMIIKQKYLDHYIDFNISEGGSEIINE